MSIRRRDFIRTVGGAGAALWTGSGLVGCGGSAKARKTSDAGAGGKASAGASSAGAAKAPATKAGPSAFEVPPAKRPDNWDVVDYNVRRGEVGFIPKKYMVDIHNPGGIEGHLGKHLPYVVKPAAARVSDGLLTLGWGDPAKGYAQHPNAPRTDANPEGHWYNWIRVSPEGDPRLEVTTTFDDWPKSTTGQLAAMTGDDPADNGGRNSIYLARLPDGLAPGDWVRVWAHCLTHGEYVDFLQIG